MKLSHRARENSPLSLSMTGMIDMVFLLLVFFLATTALVKAEKQLRTGIGIESDNQSRPDEDLEPAVITVSQIEGRIVYEFGVITTSNQAELFDRLRTYRFKSGGAFIRVADDIPFEPIAKLMSMCRSFGFDPVTYVPDQE